MLYFITFLLMFSCTLLCGMKKKPYFLIAILGHISSWIALRTKAHKVRKLISGGLEPPTFCVLDRCDNRYTTRSPVQGRWCHFYKRNRCVLSRSLNYRRTRKFSVSTSDSYDNCLKNFFQNCNFLASKNSQFLKWLYWKVLILEIFWTNFSIFSCIVLCECTEKMH